MAADKWPTVIAKLLSPFNTAIHTLEANMPLVSLVCPVWQALLDHSKAWKQGISASQKFKFAPAKVVSALETRFKKHVRLSPVIGLAAILDPQLYICDDEGDYMTNSTQWETLLGEPLLKVIEDELVRVAVALGYSADDARLEWSNFFNGRMSTAWNSMLKMCTKDYVDVKKWLFWTRPAKTAATQATPAAKVADAPKPATHAGLKARMKAWVKMGLPANDGGAEHAGFPILAAVAARALVLHATACAVERNWSAWKRLCKAERAAMTLENAQQRMAIAEFYNGH